MSALDSAGRRLVVLGDSSALIVSPAAFQLVGPGVAVNKQTIGCGGANTRLPIHLPAQFALALGPDPFHAFACRLAEARDAAGR